MHLCRRDSSWCFHKCSAASLLIYSVFSFQEGFPVCKHAPKTRSLPPWTLCRWRPESRDDFCGGFGTQEPTLPSMLGHWPLALPPPSSCSPLQCPDLFLQRCHQPGDQDTSYKAPGWLLSRTLSLRLHVAEHGRLWRTRLAPRSPSFGTFSQTQSTCSEATCERSERTFCTYSVIRSKLFPSEQTKTRDTVAKVVACDWVQIILFLL